MILINTGFKGGHDARESIVPSLGQKLLGSCLLDCALPLMSDTEICHCIKLTLMEGNEGISCQRRILHI